MTSRRSRRRWPLLLRASGGGRFWSCLNEVDRLAVAELAGSFFVVGTHAMYAYETAAGVLVDSRRRGNDEGYRGTA